MSNFAAYETQKTQKMIQEFSAKNFYSIKHKQTLSFIPSPDDTQVENYLHEVKPGINLLKLGIIYGSNASGKSNVLMALDFFRDIMLQMPQDKMSEIEGFAPFMLDESSRKEHGSMRLVFWLEQERYVHEIELDQNRIYHESLVLYSSQRPALLYDRTYDTTTDHSRVEFGEKSGIAKKGQQSIEGNTINNCSVMAAFGKSNVEASRLNKVYEFYRHGMADLLSPQVQLYTYIKEQLKRDKDNALKPFLLKMLKASDFNIVDFDIHEEEIPITPQMEMIIKNAPFLTQERDEMLQRGTLKNDELSFRHSVSNSSKYDLPEEMESVGTMRYLGMSVILHKLLSHDCFVTIDEVESSIHYELLSYFLKLFLANSMGGSQMLVTTHDLNLLDEDFIRRDVVWFTDKNEDGVTELKRLTEYGLHKTLSPYNAYKQGKLGKLPFTGSIFLEAYE